MATEVRDQPDLQRFEIRVDGELAGFARYVRKGGRIYFVHTEIEPEFEGQGVGTVLARDALDSVRATGEPVVPLCPFIAAFIEHHPDYNALVDKELFAAMEG